jgi:sugar phosphate isomerase/epimerase
MILKREIWSRNGPQSRLGYLQLGSPAHVHLCWAFLRPCRESALSLKCIQEVSRYGLICTMGYAGGGTIPDALGHTEHHAAIEEAFRKNIPIAAKAGVPSVITFSGTRRGMSDEDGARNTVLGLNRLKTIAEDHGVNICLELLNSKRDHKDYM